MSDQVLSSATIRRLETFSGHGECPECFDDVELTNVMIGEMPQCPSCGTDLEVRGHEADVIRLTLAPEVDEDYGE